MVLSGLEPSEPLPLPLAISSAASQRPQLPIARRSSQPWPSSAPRGASVCQPQQKGGRSLAGGAIAASIALASSGRLRRSGSGRGGTRRLPRQEHAETRLSTGPADGDLDNLALEVRKDFRPMSAEAYDGVQLVYLDSAATAQKPQCVIDALTHYYESSANVHRGLHALAERATEAFEDSRISIARFINARSEREVIFTSGATDAINLVANSWGASQLKSGDEIVLTVMEHHSNIVPWQLIAERTGAKLKFARLTPEQTLDVDHLESLITPRTRLVSFAHVSNVLGCVNPVERIVAAAKKVDALVFLDACQSVPHMPVDVQALGVDFIAASGHKMCGPTGVGFLWGREEILETMPPWKGGGEMIKVVTLDGSTYAGLPSRFEAGTPPIAQAVGLGAACKYLMGIGMDRIQAYEARLTKHLWDSLEQIEGLKLYGPSPHDQPRAALAAFNDTEPDVYAADLALLVDGDGYAIRAGHHCAQPLHALIGAEFGTARASMAFYNTMEEIDGFAQSVRENIEMLRAGEGCEFDPENPDACYCSSERMRS